MTRVRWATPTKVCPDCGHRFKRWSPRVGHPRKDGARYGCAYCRPCMNRRVVRHHKKRVEWQRRCFGCGKLYRPLLGTEYAARYGLRRIRYCSPMCHADSTRVYANETEKQREKKRRYRAALRARGLTCLGVPYRKPLPVSRLSQIVPPTMRR